jgi:hypothetical protein
MADKNYQITFELSDGTTKTVEFTSPQGEQGPKGDDGVTTAIKIGSKIYSLKDGTITLPEFAQKDDLASKADNVVFTKNCYAGAAFGDIAKDESLQGLTLLQIISKMLQVYEMDTNSAHKDSSDVVANIINNTLPMYTLDGQGSLVQVTYDDDYYRRMTMSAFTTKERGNFFYQIVNSEDELVQSGYSLDTVEDSQKWLTFALPNTITDFTLYMYDPNNNGGTWAPTQIVMNKGISTIEGYNVWEAQPGQDGGATYRIVINN